MGTKSTETPMGLAVTGQPMRKIFRVDSVDARSTERSVHYVDTEGRKLEIVARSILKTHDGFEGTIVELQKTNT